MSAAGWRAGGAVSLVRPSAARPAVGKGEVGGLAAAAKPAPTTGRRPYAHVRHRRAASRSAPRSCRLLRPDMPARR